MDKHYTDFYSFQFVFEFESFEDLNTKLMLFRPPAALMIEFKIV